MKSLKVVLLFTIHIMYFPFTSKAQTQNTRYEFAANGGFVIASGTDAQLTTQTNWAVIPSPPLCSNGTEKLCYILVATYNGTPPNFTTALQNVADIYDEAEHRFIVKAFTKYDGGLIQYRITVFTKS